MEIYDELTGAYLASLSGMPARITRNLDERKRLETIFDGERSRLAGGFSEKRDRLQPSWSWLPERNWRLSAHARMHCCGSPMKFRTGFEQKKPRTACSQTDWLKPNETLRSSRMKSRPCSLGLSPAIALSMAVFLTGCATVEGRLNAAGATKAEASVVEHAIGTTNRLPALPEDCRKQERSGVVAGDRLDVALLKTDRALGRANARPTRCAAWYDQLRQDFSGQPQEDRT
ncbi:hypothetical protein [Nitratireductor indicus]|uniref:hypothetical protein n=1 Tax=Nitratireductor indicus TaxID=721133 RepID=UPI00287509B9|nr:hypothetical protein [Nitratireductor indicus]MDS1135166.1 hypothetical protein [Nitratireductor indicus]